MAMFCKQPAQAETTLLQAGLIYRAIQLNIDLFRWKKYVFTSVDNICNNLQCNAILCLLYLRIKCVQVIHVYQYVCVTHAYDCACMLCAFILSKSKRQSEYHVSTYYLVFLQFSNVLLFTKNQKVRLCGQGRPDFSFLFKSCEILEVRGDLSINVENKKSSRVDRQACKNYALALTLCAFNNSKSIQKRIKSIFQILN